jgi:spectinomycin phosphotransferase
VRERPTHVTDAAVLSVVRDRWLPGAEEVEHLPVGFGAWHWQARVAGRPRLFVTLDRLGVHHTAGSLEATYAAAAGLAAQGLEFVLAPLPGEDGRFTAGFGADAVSATPWHQGTDGTGNSEGTAALLARLHAATPPEELPRWHPLVGPDLPEQLGARALAPWDRGPHGETARTAILARIDDVADWVATYLRLAAASDPADWVPTHGEPHARNQLVTRTGVLLVDWESARLAPRERDLRWLDDTRGADPDLVRMFDLEWRLDEVTQYADRFEAPHHGSESDRVALGGLLHELDRPAG